MKQQEKKLAEKLRKLLAPYGHFQRIEPFNDKGIPDINFCNKRGEETWIELKSQANKDGSVIIRKEQFAWGQKRSLLGGRVLVICRSHDDPSEVWIHAFPFNKSEYTVLQSGIKIKSTYRVETDQPQNMLMAHE